VTANMLLAIHSIPAYVACSALMLILCPPVTHQELQSPLGLGSWLDRAWCRLESTALMMQTQSDIPAVVCEGPHTAPYSLSPHLVKPPGAGSCSCCRLGHVIVDMNGNERTIPCDKRVIGEVVDTMLAVRITHEAQDLTAWRFWKATRRYWLQGLPAYPDAPQHAQDGATARLDARLPARECFQERRRSWPT